MKYKFWMVWAEGGQAPNKQHFSEFDARTEAQRLAKKTTARHTCWSPLQAMKCQSLL